MIEQLRRSLAGPLPGREAQYRMAHYSRMGFKDLMLDELPGNHRRSAVLALLFPENGEWHTVLMRRTAHNDAHSRQVSFPGGGVEPGDEGELSRTALREAHEELGIDPGRVELLGQLTELYIPVSNNLVFPFVGLTDVRPDFTPDPREVEEVLLAPLHFFWDPAYQKLADIPLPKGGLLREVPYFDVHGHLVWGATAMMLSELVAAMGEG
jgi:8-oxo-dGTP pyrophosphatase MutT (NUDIX family)